LVAGDSPRPEHRFDAPPQQDRLLATGSRLRFRLDFWRADPSRNQPVAAFSVDGGNLTELPASPTALPAGAAGFGIVVT
jgi:hypothetical protein